MRDENYIEDMRCPNPECQSKGPFRIEIDPVIAIVSEQDIDHSDAIEQWGDQSWCSCAECAHAATVGDFSTGGAK
jgi:hypothetical protein